MSRVKKVGYKAAKVRVLLNNFLTRAYTNAMKIFKFYRLLIQKKDRQAVKESTLLLARRLLIFSLPLIASNLLQILFNVSDMIVVGKFVGEVALGQVGSTTQVVLLYVGLVIGLGSGVNVITAYYIGRKSIKEIKEVVQTGLFLSLVVGVLLTAIGEALSYHTLTLMKTKSELLGGATLYLRIYLLGLPGLSLYNYAAGVISATEDTRRPLLFLSISGVLNILLNLFFVIVARKGVAGVAIASVISAYVSGILGVTSLIKEKTNIRLTLNRKVLTTLSSHKCIQILKIGLPSGAQNAIFAFANIFIQSGVNMLNSSVVIAVSVASNFDPLAYEVMSAFYAGCATFTGLNYGASNKRGVLLTYLLSLLYSSLAGAAIGIMLYLLRFPLLNIFTTNSEVINYAIIRMKIMSLSYWVSAFMDCTIAASRGLGKTVLPSAFVILGSCVFRILWIKTVFMHFLTIPSLFYLYIFSWGLTAIAEILYFIHTYKRAWQGGKRA